MGKYFDISYMIQSFPGLLSAVHITVAVTLISAFTGICLSVLLAVIRENHVKGLSQAVVVYVSFIRGTPFLVQLFLVYFGVPEILSHAGADTRNVPPLLFVLIVFTLHVAAYGSEIMRSSIAAVSEGQKEAAASLGMTGWQSYRRVILPQAFSMAVAPLINTVIGVIKGTSLIFNVGIVDIMRKADLMGGNSQRYLELFVDVALIYGVLIFFISQVGQILEKKSFLQGHVGSAASGKEPGSYGYNH